MRAGSQHNQQLLVEISACLQLRGGGELLLLTSP